MADRRFTFFESYRDVASLMSDEDRLAFYDALVGYGVCGEEPDDLEGAPLIAFKMARPSLDKSARRARANAQNAKRRTRKESEPEEPASEPEPADSEPEPTDTETETETEQASSEPVATCSEPEANASESKRTETLAQDSLDLAVIDIDKDIDKDKDKDDDRDGDRDGDRDKRGGGGAKSAPSKPRRSKPARPSFAEWMDRWREVSVEHGVPVSEYDAQKAYAYYEANGWRQKNGNPVKRWKGALSTCFLNAHPELRSNNGGGGGRDVFARYD